MTGDSFKTPSFAERTAASQTSVSQESGEKVASAPTPSEGLGQSVDRGQSEDRGQSDEPAPSDETCFSSTALDGPTSLGATESTSAAESTREAAEASLLERLKKAHTYLNSALKPDDRERLDAVYERMHGASKTLAGYPCNQVFDYTELLPFLAFSLNNVGDPFADSNYRLNTHDIEREVLADFARLTHAAEKDVWGYVTSGGTEGNMYGLYLARELFPAGIVYYSEDTHYSVAKSLRLLRARSIMIRSQENGEIDYDDLREALKIHRDVPPILFLNIGTTMKGAIDKVDEVQRILKDLRLTEHYIHCDAALSGMILPFVPNAPPWDFAAGVDSLSISGHKMLGAPVPCGVVLARRKNVERIARSVEYVGVLDTTIGGSRSAFAPLVLWYALRRWGVEGLSDLVEDCQTNALYAVDAMRARGIDAWCHEHSITVVMPRPSDNVLRRFQIAPQGNLGHLITMPHVTRRRIDHFIQEYLADPPAEFVRCARPLPGSHLRPGSLPPPPPAPATVEAAQAPAVPSIPPLEAPPPLSARPAPASAPPRHDSSPSSPPSDRPPPGSAPSGAGHDASPPHAGSSTSLPGESVPPPTKHSARDAAPPQRKNATPRESAAQPRESAAQRKDAPPRESTAQPRERAAQPRESAAQRKAGSHVRESYTNEVDDDSAPNSQDAREESA